MKLSMDCPAQRTVGANRVFRHRYRKKHGAINMINRKKGFNVYSFSDLWIDVCMITNACV